MEDSLIEKILLHLYDSVDYGFSYKLKRRLFIDDLFTSSSWENYDKKKIYDSFKNLKKSEFIVEKKQYDGSVVISLSEKGKLRALNLKFKMLSHKREPWDKRWRLVSFDIPNTYRKGRRALRYRLKLAGFYEVQESMFIYPFDCEGEIREFVKLFKLEKYVRFGLLEFIDGQDYFVKAFKLDK